MRETAILWLLVVSLIGISDTLKCCRYELLEASNLSRWSPVNSFGIARLAAASLLGGVLWNYRDENLK
jgi:hypothetical protein